MFVCMYVLYVLSICILFVLCFCKASLSTEKSATVETAYSDHGYSDQPLISGVSKLFLKRARFDNVKMPGGQYQLFTPIKVTM